MIGGVSIIILDQNRFGGGRVYKPGVDRIEEAVISSHFMQKLAENTELELYDEDQFAAKSLEIDAATVYDRLIPALVTACNAFCRDRAVSAKHRARENYRKYGLEDPREVGLAQFVTEVMFDRHYLREPNKSCPREKLCTKVQERIEAGSAIEMVIPALPYKFSSPLKTRGQLPDLADVNFMLGLYEIAATMELIYREARPELRGRLAGFTVVSDGSRFNKLVGEPDNVITEYRGHINFWIERLGLQQYITLVDYCDLLQDKLPLVTWGAKSAIISKARAEYADILWPLFDACNMASTMRAAAKVEPDPEYSNREGRFVSLLKSLIYTINYKTLMKLGQLPASQFRALYRDLTGHIFKPYTILSHFEIENIREEAEAGAGFVPTDRIKEYLRQSMLKEAWTAAIEYMAEIRSARDLEEDPILICLPTHIRWTIHAKPGQLAILTPTAFGTTVQAWAGAAVFKPTKENKIRLCTLPVLALEGAGALPVRVSGTDDALAFSRQPLFYIDPTIAFGDFDEFLSKIGRLLVRTRTS